MTSPVSAIEAVEKAMEGVTPGPWEVYDGCSWRRIGTVGRNYHDCAVLAPTVASDGHPDLTCAPGNDLYANLAYIAACSPDRMREVLALARQAEALTGIGSAHDLISDWLGEGTDDLPDDTPVRIEIGKRTIIADNLGSLRRARALLGGYENAE